MAMPPYAVVASALRERAAAIIDRWLTGYSRSLLRVPHAVDLRGLVGPARGIVDALALALAEPACGPGSPALREAEKLMAFAGGSFGMSGASAFDVAAFSCALRDVLVTEVPAAAPELGRLFDWLGALALEGYASSRLDALRLRYRDSLEKGTPVVMITRELPAALLVGEPERSVLEAVFGRLLLSTVRVGARAVIIDGGGLVVPTDPAVLEALRVFGAHPKVARITCLLTALPPPVEPMWQAAFPKGVAVACIERFDDAVAHALRLPRSP
jgi:hypothetical protein